VGARLSQGLERHASALRQSLAAAVAWGITLAPLALSTKAPAPLAALVCAALVAGAGGPLLVRQGPRAVRHVGISAFLALAGCSWLWASLSGALAGHGGYRAALGMLAWLVFAVSWFHPWSVPVHRLRRVPAGTSADLRPRRRFPRFSLALAVFGVVASATCLALAWRATEPSREVLAQAVAVACAVVLLTLSSSAAVGTARLERRAHSRKSRPQSLPRPLRTTLLLVTALIALAVLLKLTHP